MKHTFVSGCALALLLFISTPVMAEAQEVGWVQKAEGAVSIISPVGKERTAEVEMSVQPGERIVTGPGGLTQVMFLDKSVLVLAENSEVAVNAVYYDPEEPQNDAFNLTFTTGLIGMLTGEIKARNPQRFAFDTPLAYLGIRGTEFTSAIAPDMDTHALVSGGPVAVTARFSDSAQKADALTAKICSKLSLMRDKYDQAADLYRQRLMMAKYKKAQRKGREATELYNDYQCYR